MATTPAEMIKKENDSAEALMKSLIDFHMTQGCTKEEVQAAVFPALNKVIESTRVGQALAMKIEAYIEQRYTFDFKKMNDTLAKICGDDFQVIMERHDKSGFMPKMNPSFLFRIKR